MPDRLPCKGLSLFSNIVTLAAAAFNCRRFRWKSGKELRRGTFPIMTQWEMFKLNENVPGSTVNWKSNNFYLTDVIWQINLEIKIHHNSIININDVTIAELRGDHGRNGDGMAFPKFRGTKLSPREFADDSLTILSFAHRMETGPLRKR